MVISLFVLLALKDPVQGPVRTTALRDQVCTLMMLSQNSIRPPQRLQGDRLDEARFRKHLVRSGPIGGNLADHGQRGSRTYIPESHTSYRPILQDIYCPQIMISRHPSHRLSPRPFRAHPCAAYLRWDCESVSSEESYFVSNRCACEPCLARHYKNMAPISSKESQLCEKITLPGTKVSVLASIISQPPFQGAIVDLGQSSPLSTKVVTVPDVPEAKGNDLPMPSLANRYQGVPCRRQHVHRLRCVFFALTVVAIVMLML